MKYLLAFTLVAFVLPCQADDDLVSLIQNLHEKVQGRKPVVDDNGLPPFRPHTGALRRKKETVRENSGRKPDKKKVTLSAAEYAALVELAAKAKAAPETTSPAVQLPAAVDQVVDITQLDNSQIAATEPPVESGQNASAQTFPTLRIALPATPAITRPPKPSATSASGPPLRRKQQ